MASIIQVTTLGCMEHKSFSGMDCSIAQCLEVIGEWWSMLIVRDAFLGVARFDEFQSRLGISSNILQRRLARLVDTGVLARVRYSDHPPRDEYRLTSKGHDLWPVLNAMRQWGDRYAAPGGPPLLMVHDGCGSVCEAIQVCSSCGVPIGSRDVRVLLGPGRHGTDLIPKRPIAKGESDSAVDA